MQKTRNRKRSAPVALFLAIVVCGIAVLCGRLMGSSGSGNGAGSATQLSIHSVESMEPLKDGFVYYNGATIGYVNGSGREKWSYMAGTDARFRATEYGIAVWRGNSLTLLDPSNGTIYYSVTQTDPVISALVGPEYIAILCGVEQSAKVTLLSGDGSFVKTLSFDSQMVLDLGFYASGDYFWVLSLETDGTVIGSTVATFKPSSQLVSGSIVEGGQLAYRCFFQPDAIYLVGDQYIKQYDYSGKELSNQRTIVYGWYLKCVDPAASFPNMVFVPDDAFSGQAKIQDLLLYTKDGKRYARLPFPADRVAAYQGTFYGFSREYGCVMQVEPNRGTVQSFPVGVEFDTVYGVFSGNKALVGRGTEVYLISLS